MDSACLPKNWPALDEERVRGADEHGEQRDPAGDDAARPDAAQELRIAEQSDAAVWRIPQEPVEREAMPRRRGVGCVVESEYRDDDQRQKQECEERDDIERGRGAHPGRARERGDHVRRITSPNR